MEKLTQGQIRAEKRTKALKERMKKMAIGGSGLPTPAGPDPAEIYEDDEEENE